MRVSSRTRWNLSRKLRGPDTFERGLRSTSDVDSWSRAAETLIIQPGCPDWASDLLWVLPSLARGHSSYGQRACRSASSENTPPTDERTNERTTTNRPTD
jgi:hypothetical protein